MNTNDEMESMQPDIPETEEEEEQGFLDRVINIYLDPSTLFKRLAVKPDFWTPWVVVGILLAVMTAVTFPATYDLQWDFQAKALEKSGMSDEDIIKRAEAYHGATAKNIGMVIAIITVIITPVIGWLIWGAVIFLISLLQGLDTAFKRVFSVVAYVSMINILGVGVVDKIIKLAQGAKTWEEWQRSKISLAALLPAGSHGSLVGALSLIDPFFIWSAIVLAIGLTFANRCKTKAAVITVIIYVILTLIFAAGMGLLMHVFTGGGGGGAEVSVRAG